MAFGEIRADIVALIQEKYNINLNTNFSSLDDISIFGMPNELKECLEDLNIDIDSLSMDFNEVIKTDFSSTELQNEENQDDSMGNLFKSLLSDFLGNENVKKTADKSNDNKLSNDEITDFLEIMNGYDNDMETLSMDDLFGAAQNIFNENNSETQPLQPNTILSDNLVSELPKQVSSAMMPSTGGSGNLSSNISSNSTVVQNSNATTVEKKNYSNMSSEQLSAEKTSISSAMKSAYSKINSYLSGNEPSLSIEKDALENAQNNFSTALNNANIPNELKSSIEKNSTDIEANETLIADTQSNINAKQAEITESEANISNISAEINSLNATKSGLLEQLGSIVPTGTDEEAIRTAETQKAVINAAISQIEQQISEKNSELQKEQQALATKNDEIKQYQDKLDKYQNIKTTLESERQGFESQILNYEKEHQEELDAQKVQETESEDTDNQVKETEESQSQKNQLSEVQNALIELQSARNAYNNKRDIAIKDAQKEIDLLKSNYADVNAEIQKIKDKEIQREFSVDLGDLFTNESEINVEQITDGDMKYLLLSPKNLDESQEHPLLVYLHGQGQFNTSPETLTYNVAVKSILEWDMENFNGYILCPVGVGKTWCNETNETRLRSIIENFESTHNVDKNKVAVAGHSAGGMGAVYMAAKAKDENGKSLFCKSAVMSGYPAGADVSEVNIPIRGFVGNNDDPRSYNYMKGNFSEDKLSVYRAGHGTVPKLVFQEDSDGNNRSDVFEWLFDGKDY